MRYKINGLDKHIGETRIVWVEAASHAQAMDQASALQIVVSDVIEEPPFVLNGPVEVTLGKRQLRILKVSEFKIATGVFLGLLLWAVFGFLLFLLFGSLLVGAAAGA